MLKKFKLFVHIVLFSVYPALFLIVNNIVELRIQDIFSPAALLILISTLIFICIKIFIKDISKTAIFTTTISIFIFNANFFYKALNNFLGVNKLISALIFFTVIIVVLYLLHSKIKETEKITNILNFTSISLIIICLLGLPKEIFTDSINKFKTTHKKNISFNKNYPNILYIILDGYSSNNTLTKYYGFDNSEFTSWLEEKGFYVAKNSTANYPITHMSITSSLNMNYIHDKCNEDNCAYQLSKLRKTSSVPAFLKKMGYEFIHYDGSGWFSDFQEQANKKSSIRENQFNIQYFLYDNSILAFISNKSKERVIEFLWESRRNWQEKTFESIIKTCENPKISNKFIYAHFDLPHPPYLYDKYGKKITRDRTPLMEWDQKQLYLDYIIYTNNKIKEVIGEILAKSPDNNIIILQSDHGSHHYIVKHMIESGFFKNQNSVLDSNELKKDLCKSEIDYLSPKEEMIKPIFGILNAFYIPEKNRISYNFYETITPVNSFRVIFNDLFQADYPLLEDKNYFTYYGCGFIQTDVTEKLK
ncbi:MAG: hypothetical protein A2Y25_04900 [Candidatus Melainabacteria bacterium GWF2_37_15]|nr:MAG: hypothetical protein A2Y25_04900 [Candidatus Melainabacteria bacterium GWF2_37_15]